MSADRFPAEEVLTERLRLRPMSPDDAADVQKACADPTTREFLPMLPEPYTHDDAVAFIEGHAAGAFERGGAQWSITDRADGRFLGAFGLPVALHTRATVEVGYWVAPWARGEGVASEALRGVCDWVFGHGIRRVELIADLANIASQRVALAAGFRREGVRRGAGRGRDGTPLDFAAFSRLSGDPAGRTPRSLPDLPGGELSDGVALLRPLGPGDAADTFAARGEPEVMRSGVRPLAPEYPDTARKTATAYAEWLAGENARMTIRDAATGTYAGEIGLYYRSPLTRGAMLGIYLAGAARGRGLASRAMRLVSRWAFEEVGVLRLEAGTAEWNEASQALMRRLGWTREGVHRSYMWVGEEERCDNVMWSLLPGEPGGGS